MSDAAQRRAALLALVAAVKAAAAAHRGGGREDFVAAVARALGDGGNAGGLRAADLLNAAARADEWAGQL